MRSHLPIRLILLVPLVAVVAACASHGQRRNYDEARLAILARHAGDPVDRIRSFRLQSWQPISDRTLVLEARLNDWYLLEVDGPCTGLRFAMKIGFTHRSSILQPRFDSIVVDGLPCRITSIRPVDYRAARVELRQLRAQARDS
jgi:hypothetical protein